MAYSGGGTERTASAEQGLFSFAVPGSGFFMDDTGGLPFTQGLTDALGLTTNPYIAADMAAYNPYSIGTSYGGASYDQQNRQFTSSLSPQYSMARQGLFNEFGRTSPDQYLNLLRQRAAPANQANYQGLENRLFSQGRLDHSQVYQPGGAMRGLFDAQAQQDMNFQIGSDQWAQSQRQALLDQIGYFDSLENTMWNPMYQQGQLDVQASGNAAAAFSQQAGQNQSAIGGIVDSVLGGIF